MATSIRRISAWSLRAEMAKSGGTRPQKVDGDGADDTRKIRETLWKREIRAPYSGGVFLSDDRRWEEGQLLTVAPLGLQGTTRGGRLTASLRSF
jgi:hypothetical protein